MGTESWHPERHPEIPSAERAEIFDALYRYAAGIDLHDRALFESAFSRDASADFTAPARRLEATVPILEGRRAIADAVMASITELHMSHSVSNPRVTVFDGRSANAEALVEEHYLARNHSRDHVVLMNVYAVELSKESRQWVIARMTVRNLWFAGDATLLSHPLVLATRAVRPISLSARRRSAGLTPS